MDDFDDFLRKSNGGRPSDDFDAFLSGQTDVEYNSFRSGTVDFVESAVGLGDELDAAVRVLSSEADSFKEGLVQSRRELDAFERENPLASKMLTVAGVGAGLFVPGAGLAKVAQTGTKLQRAAKVGALGSAEGAAYGYASGRGEEGRQSGAMLGAAIGAPLGAGASLLTKNADEMAAVAVKQERQTGKSGGHIAGEEGFANVGRAGSATGRRKTDVSEQQRQATEIVEDGALLDKLDTPSDIRGNVFLGSKEWLEKNVGVRAARLVEDSEIMVRKELHEIDETFDDLFADATKVIEDNKAMRFALLSMNESIKKPYSWDDVMKTARNKEEIEVVNQLREQTKLLQELDPTSFRSKVDYFPTLNTSKDSVDANGRALMDAYANPVEALKNMAKDISTARVLAHRFDIDMGTKEFSKLSGNGRMDRVIQAISRRAKAEGANDGVAANLEDGLRSVIVASKLGGDTIGAISRRAASIALLANPINAILNISEGITSPLYQNGARAWLRTVPQGILATFNSQLGKMDKSWLSNETLGLNKQYMGELSNTAKQAMDEAAESAQMFRIPEGARALGIGVDTIGKWAYKLSGVETVNRMGQEMLTNSSIKEGIRLVNKGDLDKLRQHPGMRGLNDNEFRLTVDALKRGVVTDPWVINFAGASLNKWQPVNASTMPIAYNDNPNFRVMYSMLSYMNRQMNNIRTEIGLNLLKAQKQGINSKEGAQAARDAMKNAAYYTGLFGVFAGMWDDARKTMDFSNDRELEDLLTPEGVAKATLNQLASNVSGGLYNVRAQEFGGENLALNPPPLTAVGKGVTAVQKAVTNDDITPLLRVGQTYVPGIANIDRIVRMTPPSVKESLGIERKRLLTDD